jgi:hypothetical protein
MQGGNGRVCLYILSFNYIEDVMEHGWLLSIYALMAVEKWLR